MCSTSRQSARESKPCFICMHAKQSVCNAGLCTHREPGQLHGHGALAVAERQCSVTPQCYGKLAKGAAVKITMMTLKVILVINVCSAPTHKYSRTVTVLCKHKTNGKINKDTTKDIKTAG